MACWQTTCAFDGAWCCSARLYGDRGRCDHNERSFHRYSKESYGNAAAPLAFVTAHCSTMLSLRLPKLVRCTEA